MSNSIPMTRFAHNVKRLLVDYKWTQRDLAEAMGIFPQNLSRAIKGTNSPSIDFVQAVADALSVDICDLLQPIPAPQKAGK